MEMNMIEKLTLAYSSERAVLTAKVTALNDELAAATKAHLAGIRRAVAACKTAEERLHQAIEEAPELFLKPRSQTFHGIKVGMQKGSDKLEWEDDEQVIKLIRKKLSEELHEVLIKTEESLSQQALENLEPEQLKAIGVVVVEGGDHIIIKPVDGHVDKLVKALLKDKEEEQEAQRAAA